MIFGVLEDHLDVVAHGLGWGLMLSVYLTLAFVGLLRLDAEMWLEDYPSDVQEAFGPMSDEAQRRRFRLGIPVALGAVAIVCLATLQLVRGSPETAEFLPLAIHTFILLMTFNLVDLLLIDWFLFVSIQPDWIVLPGTDGLAGYSSYRFHVRAFLKGTVGIVALSLGVGLLGHLAA